MNVLGLTKLAAHPLVASIVSEPSRQSGSPCHPANSEPGAGVAVSVTTRPVEYVHVQLAPQLIEPSEEVTVPVPFAYEREAKRRPVGCANKPGGNRAPG